MKTTLTLFLLLCGTLSLTAQTNHTKKKKTRNISLYGHVKNSFTNQGIIQARITLMSEDSIALDSMTV